MTYKYIILDLHGAGARFAGTLHVSEGNDIVLLYHTCVPTT